MKRFVTYLYECERGNKSKNVGFIRVNVREEEATMEVYIRNITRSKDEGQLYALVYEEELFGIALGKVKIENGQGDTCILHQTDGIMESSFSIHDIEGIGVRLDSGTYIASCWKDEYAEGIVRGEFTIREENQGEDMLEQMMYPNMEFMQAPSGLDESASREYGATYEKIDLSQIRDLPSPNWHFATNSFLVHGFWNYGYLVLKKEMEENQERLSLGVPGIFEKPEAVMAVLFGFPNFEEVSQEMVATQKEKNQEAKEGAFGCWFVNLKL